MPFMLYEVTAKSVGEDYSLLRTVRMAGNKGPLAALQRRKNISGKLHFAWHATAEEIVGAISGPETTQAIVIDLKPNAAKNVSLYRLRDVWGYSYVDWTPLALRLEALFSDLVHENPSQFKASFVSDYASRSLLGEFLYVQGGTAGGTWNWGQVGRVNGALLWPDAFRYLCSELGLALQVGPEPIIPPQS